MSPDQTPYGIGGLARLAGVTPRTIRYYVAQGLLPAPSGAGPGTHYGPGHLERLQLIKRLQRQHLPLAEIRSQLSTLTDDEVAELNRAGGEAATPTTSALDYIRSVLVGHGTEEGGEPMHRPPPASRPPMPPTAPGVPPRAAAPPRIPLRRFALPSEVPAAAAKVAEAIEAYEPEPATESTLERSQWERLSLGPNLELHVRRPLGRHEQRRVERLITIARQVLKEELP